MQYLFLQNKNVSKNLICNSTTAYVTFLNYIIFLLKYYPNPRPKPKPDSKIHLTK